MVAYGRTRQPGKIDTTLVANYLSAVLADSPWGVWSLDNGSVVDLSGNGRTALLTNGTGSASGGPATFGYTAFVGTGYATVPYEASLNTLTGAFTAEIWFQCSADVGADSMLIARDGAADVWGMQLKTSRQMQAYTQNPSSSYQTASSATLLWSTTAWNHAVVRVTPGTAIDVFLNGVNVATFAQTAGVKSNTSAGLIMGAFTTTTRRLTGGLAWGSLYMSALSDARIAAHFAAMG